MHFREDCERLNVVNLWEALEKPQQISKALIPFNILWLLLRLTAASFLWFLFFRKWQHLLVVLLLCEDSTINVLYLECVSGSGKSMSGWRKIKFHIPPEGEKENLVGALTENFFQFNYEDLRAPSKPPKVFASKTLYLDSKGWWNRNPPHRSEKFPVRLWRLDIRSWKYR